ncbi:VOC family protein [Janibacter indicus]
MADASPWIQLFLDVPRERWERSVEFWSAATGWTPSGDRGEAGQFTTLLAADGQGWVKLQAIDEPPRIHLDLDEPDRPTAVERSVGLGARQQWVYEGVPVMRSPGGLLFCHTVEPAGRIDRSDPLRVLDQVCIDIPADLWEAEVAFWSSLLRRPLTKGGEPQFSFLGVDGALRVLLQRLDEPGGQVRAHADFAVADREVETQRHGDLGAELVAVHPWWTVLRAPDGQVYCLTDRDPATGDVR